MTEPLDQPGPPGPSAPRRQGGAARRRRPGPGAVIWGSVASFAVLFGFLVHQLRSGQDPALGAPEAQSAQPQKVLVRRVIKRRVITTVVPSPSAGGGSTVSSSGAPVVSSSAPVASAPAPVTTSAS